MNIFYYNWISILIPFFIGLFYFKRLQKPFKVFFMYVLYGVVNEIVIRVVAYAGAKNTMPGLNLYQIVTFAILSYFFFYIIKLQRHKRIFVIILFLIELCFLGYIVFIQGILEYPVLPRAIVTLFVITFTLIYFFQVMVEAKIQNLFQEPLIWITSALLIYYSGNLFYTLLFNFILEYSREFSKITVNFFVVNLTLFYILVAIGFWKAGKQKKENGTLVT